MQSNPTMTDVVTRFATGQGAEIPGTVRERAVAPIIDSLAVIMAGTGSDAGRAGLRYALAADAGDGASWAVGRAGGAPPEVAALVNATCGHALDFDDALPGSGHLSVPMLAAILATASTRTEPLSGGELIDSFVTGFEVAAKMGKALGVQHYLRGWHTTATAGTLGTAVAAARTLRLDETGMRTALGLASSMIGGLQVNFGTMAKPLQSGLAARNGVTAALLASVGFTASPTVLDGAAGVLELYGLGAARPEMLEELGQRWSLLEPGTALKRYPCCYAAARPIDALLDLRSQHGILPASVAGIHCAVPKTGLHPMIHHDPQTGLNAKFSMEYVLAAAMIDGTINLASFEDVAVQRPDVRALMQRVTLSEERDLRPEDPDAVRSSPATGGRVEVTVTLVDGTTVTASVAQPKGSPSNPLSSSELAEKFLSCARYGGWQERAASRVLEALQDLENVPDVAALVGQLALARPESAPRGQELK